MKKIWILYTGIGNGHKSVGESIKHELETNQKDDFRVEIFDSVEYANPVVFRAMVSLAVFLQKYNPRIFDYFYKLGNQMVKTTNPSWFSRLVIGLFSTKKFTKLIQKEQPDLVVSTYFLNNRQISFLKRRGLYDVPLISVITDHICHNWFLNWQENVDWFVVPDRNVRMKFIEKGVSALKVCDFGIPIDGDFSSCLSLKPKGKTAATLSGPKLKILFFGGGGLGYETSLPYLSALAINQDLEIKFIAGKNRNLYQKAQKITSVGKIEVVGYTNEVPQLMAWADLVVSKAGGITITESVNSEVPLVLIQSFGGHEKGNVDFVVENDLGVWCGSPDKLKSVVRDLNQNPKRIKKMQENCRRLAKRNATQDVARLALETI